MDDQSQCKFAFPVQPNQQDTLNERGLLAWLEKFKGLPGFRGFPAL